MSIPSDKFQEAGEGLRAAVERVLMDRLGRIVRFSSMVCLTEAERRTAVYRCTDEAGGTYIVKQSPHYSAESLLNWESAPWEVKGFFNDWIGSEFLSAIPNVEKMSPGFFGGDAQIGFFVLEDLGEHPGLTEHLLHGDSTSAEEGLMRFGSSLGQMHALTAGKVEEFERLYQDRLPGVRPFAMELDHLEEGIEKIKVTLADLGVPVSGAMDAEIQAIVETVRQPGPFLTYIHADPCPDNQFDLGDRFVLFDFETGHFGHALIDATYPRMFWQTCWCANRLPGDVIRRWEARYRAELAKGVPEALDDTVWEDALMDVCGLKLLMTLNWHLAEAMAEDHDWGIATIRQRVLARLEAFIGSCDEFNRLPALRGMASAALPILSARWKDLTPMPLYPAFQK